jgi:sec-independent protein translocase protein TatC
MPLMVAVPFLFISGVVFGYLIVVPAAVKFLQNFHADSYDILIQARDYYKFTIMIMGAMGLLFQMPVAIVAITRLGILTTRQLRKNRRYAILVIAIIAMLMPGQDPVTMLSMMVPMLVLYEVSILASAFLDRQARRRAAARPAEPALDDF